MASTYDLADLNVIRYEDVLARDPTECQALLQACKEWGFFYLDLGRSHVGRQYMESNRDVLAFSKEYFARPLDTKLCDTRQEFGTFNICGYKPMALDTGNMKSKKDGCEGLRIPSDLCNHVTENPTLSIPPGAEKDWPTLRSFNNQSHKIATDLLCSLSDSMGRVGPERFEYHHRADCSSTTTTVLQCYPHQLDLDKDISVGHFTHTDTGSITLLFNTEWGLQVHSPDSETWKWIAPHPDYAIVNVGDSLKFMSKLGLKSALHRVVPAERKWNSGPRYATIFFLRANNDAEFDDLEGQRWKAGDWLMRKFGGYRQSHAIQATNAVSTGKVGFVGLWEDGSKEPHSRKDSKMMD